MGKALAHLSQPHAFPEIAIYTWAFNIQTSTSLHLPIHIQASSSSSTSLSKKNCYDGVKRWRWTLVGP